MKVSMKKFYLVATALLLTVGIAGCGGNEASQKNEKVTEDESLNLILGRVKKLVEEKTKAPVLPDTETEIPIIMYHYVRAVDANKDPLGYNLSINPSDFEKQIKYLKDQGYVGIHLADLVDGKVPKKAVVLSFDDGLEDFYTTALPILQKYEFTASNSVITGMIGAHEHMTVEQIRECVKAGIEITSHTVSHLDLPKQSPAEIKKQLVESKKFLEKTFELKVIGFIYPSGKFNDIVVQAVRDAGYKIAATTQYGEADLAKNKILLLPRIRIDNRDSYTGFVKKLGAVENGAKKYP